MSRHYVFSDEAGCFTFDKRPNVSRYFILCTVTMGTCEVGASLMSLRRELACSDLAAHQGDYFHACEDKQTIRDKVFDCLLQHDFSVQATIMEKSKTQPQVRVDRNRFYKHSWFYHFKYGVSGRLLQHPQVLITVASIGTKKEKLSFTNAISDVMAQTLVPKWAVDFLPSASDPCLQVADYCAWAIQRKWERQDSRAYDLIKSRIGYEYDLFEKGLTHYY